ncbi:MAG TPA: invasin domain 3-containing protein, partial [Gemmatimonadales bacterium]|nr:invasin domain 3-containing protein [Gemmatimonadales bacterium]
ARDQFGNPIPGATVVLAVSGTGNSLTQPGATDAAGVATGTLSATGAGNKVVSATINDTPISQTATVAVAPAPADATQSTVAVAPGSITAGAEIATLTVTARDQFGNPVEGATVVLTASGSGNTVTQSGMTDAAGVTTGSLSATVAESKIVSVAIDGTAISQTVTIAVSPAGVSAAQSTLTAAAGMITASTGASSTTLSVTARDAFGNLIPGATVVLAVSGTGNSLTQPGATDAAGVATGTLSATVAEGKTVAATIDGTGITQTAAVTVTPAGVSATQSTLTAASGTITASEGTSSTSIAVTARDAFGNPIPGATVVLAASGSGNTLTQPPPTNASGLTIGTLSATGAGVKVISASIAGTGVTQTATVLVTPAGVSAEQSTVTAAPGTIVASSGSGSTTVTVAARDAFGNPIPGATVVLAATGTGNTVTQPGPTEANGIASGTLSSTAAGDKVVSATVNGTEVTETATVTIQPAGVDAVQSTVVAAPGSITAGSGIATITVTARDQFGNPIEGAAVVLAASGGGNTVTQPAMTNAAGVATGTLSATVAEGKTVAATIDGTGIAQTAAVTVTPAGVSTTQSTLTAASGTITASEGTSSTSIAVTARDAFGNPIPGATVVLAASGSGNTLTQPPPTDASGLTIGTLSSTTAGDRVVSASIDGTAISQSAAVAVTPAGASAAQSTLTAAAGMITASTGASSTTLSVTARDAFGNLIPGATVALAVTGTGNTLTQPATPTDANGIATGTLSATVAEDKVVSATVDGIGVTQTVTVTTAAAAADAAQSTVTAAPASITAGSDVATITVTARDQFGNPVPGATVVVAATGAGITLVQPGVTSVGGVTTGTLSATGAGAKVISATIDGTGVTQTATVTVTPAGVSATQSTVVAAPATLVAGSDLATITVTARDPFGNPIPGATVVLTATGSGNTLTQPAGSTNAAGATTATLSSTAAETKTVSATINGHAITQTATVSVGHAGVDGAQSTLTAAPASITAGSDVATITVTARDQFGNPVPGATVVVAATGAGITLVQPGVTSVGGVTTATLSATGAGAKVISASIAGTGVTQTATVLVTPAGVSAEQSTVTAAPGTIVASSGSGSTTVTVAARDAFGNPIQDATVVLAATGTGNTVTQPGPTEANGIASGTLSSTAAGDKVVSATINGTGVGQTVIISVLAAAVSGDQSTVIASPGTVTASNGSSSATITVTARDQFGNPIEGRAVVLAASGTANSLTQPATTTDANGIATGTLTATVAETKTVTASVDGLLITQQASVLVTPAAAQQLVFRVQPTSVTAGANLAPAVEVEILDEFANRVTSAANAVALAIATNPAGGTLTGGDAVVAVDGIASFAGLSVNKAGSGYTLQASSPGLTGATSSGFTVTPGAVSADQSTVAVTPGSITAGSGLATITVTARDAFGNPIEGAAVVLEATGTGNTLIQPATTTDANGVATGTLSATGAGDKQISAAIAGTEVMQTATVTVEAAGVDPAQSTVLAAPEAITASNGVSSATIMVTARDQFGNPIAGATVLLAASGTGNALTQPGTATDLSGLVTGTLSATAAGSKTVTATIDEVPITQQANVLVTPAAADHLVFLVQPTDVTADASITPPVEVEIRDPFGNRATSAGDQVTLAIASNPGAGTLTGGGPAAAVSGVASFAAINVNKVGAGYTLAAASPGLGGATSDPFAVTPGAVSPVQSTVIAAPASIPVGSGVTTITVTARDANDNPIPSATVVLAAAGTAPVLTQPAAPTAADGTATGTLSATLSGGKTVSAVINGTPIAQTAIVAVQPPPGSVVLVGAGDIADCLQPTDEATAALLDTIPGTVFTAGDNAYPDGTALDFTNCYEPTWGRHKARTRPSPGNHDYRTPSATAYYDYFGANAGSGGWGFYSYDLGDWHIISLNSEIGMSETSTQLAWLRADLLANTKQCTLAYWHKPLFSSGEHGSLVKSKLVWRELQEYNAEVVVVGHDHNYERFAPQDTLGIADPDRGLREFVVGTGGTDLRTMNAPVPNSEVRNSDTHGVLKFTLYSTGYEWEFVPIAGKTFTDSGSGTCH